MSNRRANKRLYQAVRRRMLATGERYQRARAAVLAQHAALADHVAVDTPTGRLRVGFISTRSFGLPLVYFLLCTEHFTSLSALGPAMATRHAGIGGFLPHLHIRSRRAS